MTKRSLPGTAGLLAALLLCSVQPACMGSPEDRVALDEETGRLESSVGRIEVQGGLASVRRFEDGAIELWAQSPVLEIDLEVVQERAEGWELTIRNAMPDGVLSLDGDELEGLAATKPTARSWPLPLSPGRSHELRFAPSDSETPEAFRFAVLSDIQDAVDRMQDIVELINAEPELRFVVSTGDLVSSGERDQLERIQSELEELSVPLFSTVGNHEFIGSDGARAAQDWAELFGRFSFHFWFKGAHFVFADSGSATVAPTVYDWLEDWLAESNPGTTVVVTHIPALDPVGVRAGAFRHRKEAAKFLRLLATEDADVIFYGHIHSYYSFSNGGIPAFISGGGGAIPETFDGVGRHFLRVDTVPALEELAVSVRRVD